MKRLILYSILYMACQLNTYAQMEKVKPLKIGDHVPNIEVHNIKNFPKQKAELKDFVRGKKLLILDFWSRSCSVCINEMPKTQGLQDTFDSDIQIVYVLCPDDSSHYETLRSRIPNVRALKLPNVIGDNLLYKHLFPHRFNPYQVWLDQDLKVIASSDQIALTDANVQDYLNDDLGNFPSGESDTYLIDLFNKRYTSLLGASARRGKEQMLNYSLITKSIKGILIPSSGRLTDSASGKQVGLKYLNKTVKYMYDRTFFLKYGTINNGGVLLMSKDSVYHDFVNRNKDISKYTYCYESYFNGQFNAEEAREKLRTDLDQHFNLISTYENIPAKCLIISIVDSVKFKKLQSKFKVFLDEKGSKIVGARSYVPPSNKGFVIEGQSLSMIKTYLEKHYESKFYIIDEIRNGVFDAFDIDLKLSSSLEDLKALQKELLQHGVLLKEEERPLRFLVVRDAI